MAKKAVKKTTKKVVKKEVKKEVVKEPIVEEPVKEEVKTVGRKGINKKVMALLYLLCSICWLGSGVLEVRAKTSGVLSFVVGGILLLLAIFYFYKDSKQK